MQLKQIIGNGNELLRNLSKEAKAKYSLSSDEVVDLAKTAYTHIFDDVTDDEALAYALICFAILNSQTIDNPTIKHGRAISAIADGLETELTALKLQFALNNTNIAKLVEIIVEFYPNPVLLISEDTIEEIACSIVEHFGK